MKIGKLKILDFQKIEIFKFYLILIFSFKKI